LAKVDAKYPLDFMMHSREIFVTGASGIAGNFAVQEFSSRSILQRLLLRNPEKNYPAEVHIVRGELASPKEIERLARNSGGIVHYACATLTDKSDPQVDLDAMEALLKAWEQGAFVFISSIDVYGKPQVKTVTESHPYSDRIGPYAVAKIESEKMLMEAAKKRGRADFTIFRAPWILAPSPRSRDHMVRRFLKGKEKIVLPIKKTVDSWIDARELAWLVAEALIKPMGGAGNPINSQFIWQDFLAFLLKLNHSKAPIILQENLPKELADLFDGEASYSGDLVRNHFGFQPKYRWQDTLEQAFSFKEVLP